MSSRSQKISSGVSAILVGTILANIVGIIFQPILVRLLGTAKYGELATILAVFGIISNIALLGMQNSIRKHITQYSDSLDQIASFSIFFICGTGIISILAGYLVLSLKPVRSFLGSELSMLLILSLPALLTTNLFHGFRSILFGLYSESYGELLRITRKLLYPVIAIALILLGFEIRGVIYALILSSLCAGVLGYFFTRKSVNFSVENLMTGYRENGRELASYGTLLLFSLLFAQLHYQADVLLVRYFEGEATTGIYKGVLVVAQFLWIAPKAIQQTMLHNVSDMFSKEKYNKIEDITAKLTRYSIVILVLLGSGLVILAKPFLTIYYGKKFVSGVLPLQILIVGVVFMGIARLLTPLLEGTNYMKNSVVISVIASTANILLNLFLIPKFGITGAAVATSFSYGSLMFLYALSVRKKIGISVFPRLEIGKLFLSFAILFLSILGISSFLSSNVTKMMIIPVFGFLIYSFTVFKLDILDVNEVFGLAENTLLYEFNTTKNLLEKIRCIINRII